MSHFRSFFTRFRTTGIIYAYRFCARFLSAINIQGKRFSLPNSRIMIHQPLGGAQGQAADIEIQANEIMVSVQPHLLKKSLSS